MHADVTSSDTLTAHLTGPDNTVTPKAAKKGCFWEVEEVSSTREVTVTFSKAPVQWPEPGMCWAFVVQREHLSVHNWLLTPSLHVIKESHKKEVSTLLSLPGKQTWLFPRSLLVRNYAASKAARRFGCPSTCLLCSCHYLCFLYLELNNPSLPFLLGFSNSWKWKSIAFLLLQGRAFQIIMSYCAAAAAWSLRSRNRPWMQFPVKQMPFSSISLLTSNIGLDQHWVFIKWYVSGMAKKTQKLFWFGFFFFVNYFTLESLNK